MRCVQLVGIWQVCGNGNESTHDPGRGVVWPVSASIGPDAARAPRRGPTASTESAEAGEGEPPGPRFRE